MAFDGSFWAMLRKRIAASLRAAESVIENLESSERWSSEGCDQLREHLYGCDEPAATT